MNSFFGNLRNGGNFEGIWGNLTDDNRVWIGSRNGITFGRWDANNPMVVAPEPLRGNRYYVVSGRMGAGTGEVRIELFINGHTPVSARPFPVNPKANSSKLAIGRERDATNHPDVEAFDGELAKFLLYGRPLADDELKRTHGVPEENLLDIVTPAWKVMSWRWRPDLNRRIGVLQTPPLATWVRHLAGDSSEV